MPGGKTKCRKHSRSAPAAFASDRRISFGRVAGLPGDPQCVPCNIAAQDTQRLHRASSLPCGAICTLSGWDELPSSALSLVFDQLAPRDLAAAAITCKAWHREAVHDNRWEQYWRNDVGDQSLWGWARAGGGYREQLKARASVRKGDCTATVFPLGRLEGPVVEVLMRDGGSWQRIITAQLQLSRPDSIRLKGATVKVWDAAGLSSQRPSLTVHDCLKHLQLEDGRLLLWRIANDAIICTRSSDPSDEAAVREGEHWAEHPDIVASILDPATPGLTDVPLTSRFGCGSQPSEWQDMFEGCVGCVALERAHHRMRAQVFQLATGALVMESSCAVPEVEGAAEWGDSDVSCVMTRSADPQAPLLLAAVLFDCRIFSWQLPPAPFTSQASTQHAQQQLQGQQSGGAGAERGTQPASGLQAVFTTPEQEPIVDVSVSTPSGRVFVVGMENIFVLGLDGRPLMIVNMLQWKGVSPSHFFAPQDVGAFSWPLPCSSKAAFYLDCNSSLYVADFRRPQLADYRVMHDNHRLAGDGVHPQFDNLLALSPDTFFPNQPYYLQVHTDLRPCEPGSSTLQGGRGSGKGGSCLQEPVVVEYPQEGSCVFTVGDASCHAVARLLKLEKQRGTYLQGLGPCCSSGPSRSGGGNKRVVAGSSGRGEKGGARGTGPSRAIVCIDAATGCRFKAIPIEGIVEAIHSSGHYLVAAVAGAEGYPEGARGSLVVLDFSKQPGGYGGEAQQVPPTAKGVGSRGKASRNKRSDAGKDTILRERSGAKGSKRGSVGVGVQGRQQPSNDSLDATLTAAGKKRAKRK